MFHIKVNELEKKWMLPSINLTFYFYGDLNQFLPKSQGKCTSSRRIYYTAKGKPAVKDTIEALGVPHTEVDIITVNGESVGFYYQLKNHDRVKIYPINFKSNYYVHKQKLITPLFAY